ncbi:MAG: GNAT family N-acetyltransferase [Bdellovibrionales bacterium]
MPENLTVMCGSETVAVEVLAWDTQMLERPSARVVEIRGQDPAPHYSPLVERLREAGLEYVTIRRPQSEWMRLHALESVGFRVVDGILTFVRNVTEDRVTQNAKLRLASSAEAEAVARLAADCFRFSRFHSDPLLSPEIAARVHSEWARNSCLGAAADAAWISESEEAVIGFCACTKGADRLGTITLIGVDPRHSGKGIGGMLMRQACGWLAQQGVDSVQIQTQSHNLAAMGLYFRTGFRLHSSSFTLRWAAAKA